MTLAADEAFIGNVNGGGPAFSVIRLAFVNKPRTVAFSLSLSFEVCSGMDDLGRDPRQILLTERYVQTRTLYAGALRKLRVP